MRSTIAEMLKKEFQTLLRSARFSRKYTQEKMAETLCMDTRSYQDLERGVSLCSLTTYFIFKIQFSEIDLTYIDESVSDLIARYYDYDETENA